MRSFADTANEIRLRNSPIRRYSLRNSLAKFGRARSPLLYLPAAPPAERCGAWFWRRGKSVCAFGTGQLLKLCFGTASSFIFWSLRPQKVAALGFGEEVIQYAKSGPGRLNNQAIEPPYLELPRMFSFPEASSVHAINTNSNFHISN